MPLNLIRDPWIPVVNMDGSKQIIALWQMTDMQIRRLDWPRPDLNIACMELLIGLVFLADPPEDYEEWEDRLAPEPERLRAKLEAFSPAFNLTGDGPLFMQDFSALEGAQNAPDMLFIDSAGESTARKNADLMVWRDRYPSLTPAMAAIAIYTLQAFAPSGGAGNRTSMRGGGPMVNLLMPEDRLWPIIWANMPSGEAGTADVLPWMRPCVTSEGGHKVHPEQAHPSEVFFGMPRRLRLVEEDELITGVIQRPWGTNYAGWDHPLTPYYRVKVTEEWLPAHPKAGHFGYRNWLGVVVGQADQETALHRRAEMVKAWGSRGYAQARLLVAGWSMDNMKPRDFIQSTPPFVNLEGAAHGVLLGMIDAAKCYARELRSALAVVLAEGEAREAVQEEFYLQTQVGFDVGLAGLMNGDDPAGVAKTWVADMRRVAMSLFEAQALPGLSERDTTEQEKIVAAHRYLVGSFNGRGKNGRDAYGALGLEPATTKQKEAAL